MGHDADIDAMLKQSNEEMNQKVESPAAAPPTMPAAAPPTVVDDSTPPVHPPTFTAD
eukprot:NODE_5267_length_597_cov_165.300738.p3 GENE.NODE_5267_length_597_cov_165.300738~~NODE_5267_length_597_cov_165.300738.p3  ORF type:complete len:57 (-),score=19.02 NODE_5267_length_597_cov_165.300738:409-579(-)